MEVDERVCRLAALKNKKRVLEAQLEGCKEEIEQHENYFVTWMEETGLQQVKSKRGPMVFSGKPRVKAWWKQENKERALDWLRETGNAGVIKEDVHHSTRSALVGQLLEDGTQIPDYIDYSVRPTVGVRANGFTEEA